MDNSARAMSETYRLCWRPATLFVVMVLATLHVQARKNATPKEAQLVPKLLLSASPVYGFAPLSVQLVATLSGIDPRNPNFCHATVTWIRVDPGASPEKETRLTEAPRCVHAESESSVPTTWSKTFDLDWPGSYLYRVQVAGKDGKEVRSNYVTVKILRVP